MSYTMPGGDERAHEDGRAIRRAVESGDGDAVSFSVIDAVATLKDVDPVELEPLTAAVDPDALERLWGADDDQDAGYVAFPYAGCHVTVSADGEVVARVE